MVKSKNGGVSWAPLIELGNAVSVRDVKVDTSTNRDIVLVATDNGLYRSADEGATYADVSTFTGLSVWSIARTSAGWLASAQPCPAGQRRPAVRTGNDALPLDRSRSDVGADHERRQRLQRERPHDAGASACRVTPWSTPTRARSDDAQMRDVYRSADGGQTWVANGVNSTKIPTNPGAGASACRT